MRSSSVGTVVSVLLVLATTVKLLHSCDRQQQHAAAQGQPATCGSMMGIVAPSTSDTAEYVAQFEFATQAKDLIVETCLAEAWSQEAIDCVASGSGLVGLTLAQCETQIGAARLEALSTKIGELERKHLDKRAGNAERSPDVR
jgi:hypothetical protein